MEEYFGRIILSEDELRKMHDVALHPDHSALQRRDRFLSRFSEGFFKYEPDGSTCFELPECVTKETVITDFKVFFKLSNLSRPTITDADIYLVDAA